MMFIYSLLFILFMGYVIYREITYVRGIGREVRFLSDFDEFLSHVRHFYYYTNSAEDAIFYSIPRCSRQLKGVLEELLESLESEDRLSMISAVSGGQHKFVRLFTSLVMLVSENGDSAEDSGSVFLDSVMQLRSDVQQEKRYLLGKRHRFTGLGLTAALPPLAVPFVAAWGSDTIPSLKGFYYGRNGSIMLCAILVITMMCYSAILYLREEKLKNTISTGRKLLSGLNGKRKSGITAGLIRRFDFSKLSLNIKRSVLAVLAVIITIPVILLGHFEARQLLKNDVSDIENVSDTADGNQLNAMAKAIPEYMKRMITENKEVSEYDADEMTEKLLDEPGIRSRKVAFDTAEELLRRLSQYRKEYFDWIDFLIVFIAASAAWFFPDIGNTFKGALMEGRKQDEVMRFQSLIHMQKRVPGITPAEILESMEAFADVFKDGLRQCINNFNVNEAQALRDLEEQENYPEFRKLIDCFMAVDEAGVENAFEEVTAQLKNFKENREQDRLILLDNNVLLASLLAVIPGGLVLFGYLLIPFMARAMTMFNNYQDALQGYINSN